jgi:translation initiation factor 4A
MVSFSRLSWHIFTIILLDLPKAVEEYAHRYGARDSLSHFDLTRLSVSVAPAIAPSHSRAGVVVNFVTATGGDVEMLRSIECFYK